MKKKRYIVPQTEKIALTERFHMLAGSTHMGKIWDETTQSWIDGPEMGGDSEATEVTDAKRFPSRSGAFDNWDEE